MKKFIVNLITGIKDIVYPPTCLVCKAKTGVNRADEPVCFKCLSGIARNSPPFCPRCGRNLSGSSPAGKLCRGCLQKQVHFDRAFAPCVYEGAIKDLIHEFKYNGRDYLAPVLARLMIDFIREYSLPLSSVDLITPVPLHPARLREREFNQAQLLALEIGRAFEKPVSADNLLRRRYTRAQAELESGQRLENVKESFAVKTPGLFKSKNILLVDDVMTTGATSSEAAAALKAAGAATVLVLTLAN